MGTGALPPRSRAAGIAVGVLGLAGATAALLRSHLEAAAAPPGSEAPRVFALVWGGSAAVVLVWAAVSLLRRSGRELAFPLILIAFCCAFTTHAALTASTSLDFANLERPPGLGVLFLLVHAGLLAWILGVRVASEADRGLLLLLLFHALNRDLYLAEADLIALFAGLLVLRALAEDGGRLVKPPGLILAPLAVFLIWVMLSIALASQPARAQVAAAYIFACACAWALLAGRPRREEGFLLTALLTLLLGSSLVLLAAVLQLSGVASVLGWSVALSSRLGVLYQHPNMLGPYLATMGLLSLALRPLLRRPSRRALLVLNALLCLLGLWLTDSRTAFAGCLAGAAVLAAGTARRVLRPSRRALPLALAVLLALVALVALASTRAESLLDATRITRALEFRRDAWSYSLESVAEHPLFGIGPDTFPTTQDPSQGSLFGHTVGVPHPHNQLLYVAKSSGLPALAALLALLVGYALLALRVARSDGEKPRRLALACLAGSTTLLFCGIFDDSQSFTTLISRPEWVFLGVVAALARPSGKAAAPGRGPGPEVVPGTVPGTAPVFGSLPGLGLAVVALLGFALLGLRPAAARALVDRSTAAQRAGRLDAAAEDAALALRIDPDHRDALDRLLLCERERGSPGAALAHAEELVRRAPGDAAAQRKLGVLRASVGDQEGALAAFRRAVELGRGDADRAHHSRALIQALADAGAAAEARAALADAVRIDGKVLALLSSQKRADGALLFPVTGAAPIDLEQVLREVRQEALAEAAGEQPVDRYPWWNLYFACRERFDELALLVLSDIEGLFPDRPQEQAAAAFQRAMLAKQRGREEEAREWLEQAVAFGDPTSPAAERLHRGHLASLSPGGASARAAKLHQVLDEFADFRAEAPTYVSLLDELLAVLEQGGDARATVDAARQRAFFAVDPLEKARLKLDGAAALSAAGEARAAEAEALAALRILWEAELSAELRIDAHPAARASLVRAARILWTSARALGLQAPEARARLRDATAFLERPSVAALLRRSLVEAPP